MRKNNTEKEDVEPKIFTAIQVVLGLMDECNQLCLKYVIRLLADIAVYSEENKMTPKNLSVCWSPSLSFTNDEPDDLIASLQAMANDRFVVEFLIQHADDIFNIREKAAGGDDNNEKKEEEEEQTKMEDEMISDLNILPAVVTSVDDVQAPSAPKPKRPSPAKSRRASTVYREIEHSVSSLSRTQVPHNDKSPFALWGKSEELAKQRRSDAVNSVMETLRVSADGNIQKAHDVLKELLTAVEYRLDMLGIKTNTGPSYEGDSSEEEGTTTLSTPRLSL